MRTVVFGAGYWGINYIKELGSNLVAVVDPDETKRNYVSKTYNVPTFVDYFLIDFPEFDYAIIATPPSCHVDLALKLVKQDKKVLIEKPLALSSEEGYKLHKYKDQIMSGLIYLYHPLVEELKGKIKGQPINHIFSRRTNDGPIRPWQDAAWDLAPHDISILNYILGEKPILISGHLERDYASIILTYLNFEAIIYVSWVGGPKVRQLEIVIPGDRIIFDDMKQVLPVSPMRRMLDDFFTGEWDQKCSFDNGMEVVRVLEAVK